MVAAANVLARGQTAAAGTNNVVYTAPTSQVTRLTGLILYNAHTAPVDVLFTLGSYPALFFTLQAKETLPLSLNDYLSGGEVVYINPTVANVVAWHLSGVNDVNG